MSTLVSSYESRARRARLALSETSTSAIQT